MESPYPSTGPLRLFAAMDEAADLRLIPALAALFGPLRYRFPSVRLQCGQCQLIGGANEHTIRNEMERSKFEALVAQALNGLPRTFRERLTNVAIIVEDLPPEEPERQRLLLGLFHGIPRTEKSVFSSNPPDRIFLYQRNIEPICANDAELRRQVRATLLHEVGHYFGLSEDEVRGL